MRIGILGSGRMGGQIGRVLAQLGHEVIFSYSRRPQRLQALAREAGGLARAGTPAEAAEADMVLLAVHWSQVEDVLAQSGPLAGKVVLSCCVPLNDSDTELLVAHTDSGAETLARRLPQARLVATFQTTPSEVFADVFAARETLPRPHLLCCGDDAGAKAQAAQLIAEMGFEALDAGALRVARYTEPFAMLTAELAYGGGRSPEMAYRFHFY